jgi:hypothetical protein
MFDRADEIVAAVVLCLAANYVVWGIFGLAKRKVATRY